MNFMETVSRIVPSSSEKEQSGAMLLKVFLKFGENGFLGLARKSWNSKAKFCNDSRRWELCTGESVEISLKRVGFKTKVGEVSSTTRFQSLDSLNDLNTYCFCPATHE